MSGKGLTPGHADYFEREVASGREDYYAGRGESPGVWNGRGAAQAGLEGQVGTGQLEALFNQVHPETGELLGKSYAVSGSYVDRWGSEQPRHKQAAFDATFSVPKSVSELFAQLDPDRQALVVTAASAGNQAALEHLDRHAAFSRVGKGGVRQVDTDGLVVASYMHRTSRAGDPQLHFHNLIANRVRCTEDGVWRAVDGRHVRAEQKAAGMIGQAAMRASLEASLGVEFGVVSKDGQAEILGVPQGLIDFHSKRGKQVKTAGAELISAAEEKLQRSLTPTERAVKYREAALQTRTAKSKDMDEIEGLADRWKAEAIDAGHDPAQWLGDVIGRPRTLEQARSVPDAELVEEALEVLMETRSTWGRTHATRELARLVPHQLTTPEAVAERIEALTDQLMVDDGVLAITLGPPTHDGPGLVRADGTSQFVRHNTARYTTDLTLEREQEILDHAEQGRSTNTAVPHPSSVTEAIEERVADGRPLSPDQEAAVRAVTMSGDAVSVLVGPAGAGKSATLRTVAEIYDDSNIPIRGLAPSAKAAAVLRTEAGISNADTLAKLLHEHTRNERPAPQYQLQPGEVIVLDEASMASTDALRAIVELAQTAEAKLLLVGDYRQLGAVDAGGMFRLLANDPTTTAELDQVWRFSADWEKAASLQLRSGDVSVLDTYDWHGRIREGGRTELIDNAFDQWATNRSEGASVIVTAPDRATVAEFNQRARTHLQTQGVVHPESMAVGGIDVSVGDEILTLRNDRRLIASDNTAVRNGDRWRIQSLEADGGIGVARLDEYNQAGAGITLPAEYIEAGHVDHAYATTVHKAQGVTVDVALTIVDERTTAESLYVAATRGRHNNQLLVVTDVELGEFDIDGPPVTAFDVLTTAVGRESAERSATELIRSQIEPDLTERIATPPPIEPAANEPAIEQTPAAVVEPPARNIEPEQPNRLEVGVGNGVEGEAERFVVSGRQLAYTPQDAPTDRELTGEELHGLSVRRQQLVNKVTAAQNGLGSIRDGRSSDQKTLDGLRDRKTRVQRDDIDRPREAIEQIRHRGVIGQLTTGPKERLDDRKRIATLEQRITDGYAKIRGLDVQITRQQTVMVQAEQGLDGKAKTETRHRQVIGYNEPKIGVIDQVLDADIGRRAGRILDTHTADRGLLDRYRLVEPPGNAPDDVFERWVGVVARAEQYDQTWQGQTPEARSVEWHAQDHNYTNLSSARRGAERALEPYRPQITRPGPDLGFGLSR